MTLSDEKIAAYAKLDEAVEAIRMAYGYDNDILTGWLLLTSSVELLEHSADCTEDDLDMRSAGGWYTKRGQDPTLSLGIIHESLRHYNDVQKEFGDEE